MASETAKFLYQNKGALFLSPDFLVSHPRFSYSQSPSIYIELILSLEIPEGYVKFDWESRGISFKIILNTGVLLFYYFGIFTRINSSGLPCETPAKEKPYGISGYFHHRRHHGRSNSETSNPKINASTTDPSNSDFRKIQTFFLEKRNFDLFNPHWCSIYFIMFSKYSLQ